MKKILIILFSFFVLGCTGEKERVTFSKHEISEITSNYEKIIKERKNYIIKDENLKKLILNEIVGNIDNFNVLYYEIIKTDNVEGKIPKLHNYIHDIFRGKKYNETWSFKILPAFSDDKLNYGQNYMTFLKIGEEIQCGSYFFQFRKMDQGHGEYIIMLITKIRP